MLYWNMWKSFQSRSAVATNRKIWKRFYSSHVKLFHYEDKVFRHEEFRHDSKIFLIKSFRHEDKIFLHKSFRIDSKMILRIMEQWRRTSSIYLLNVKSPVRILSHKFNNDCTHIWLSQVKMTEWQQRCEDQIGKSIIWIREFKIHFKR